MKFFFTSPKPPRQNRETARFSPPLPPRAERRQENLLINEISLVLAEKRTSLSVMRTGLAVLALPLSVLSVLIVISRYYDPGRVMHLLGPLLLVCAGLTVLGIYMIAVSTKRIHILNRVILDLKRQNTHLWALSVVMEEQSPAVGPDPDF
jgi:hypothetical protein